MIIYTDIFDYYDTLLEPNEINKNITYVCFSNVKLKKNTVWNIKLVNTPNLINVRKARYYKINSHLLFTDEYIVWIDGNHIILKDFSRIIKKWIGKNDIAVRSHPSRKCIYEEAAACIKRKKDGADIINKQMDFYRSQNYPKNNGMVHSGFLIRRNTEKTKTFNEMWWSLVSQYSYRDQLSFNYVSWKTGIEYSLIQWDECNKYVKWIGGHRHGKPL